MAPPTASVQSTCAREPADNADDQPDRERDEQHQSPERGQDPGGGRQPVGWLEHPLEESPLSHELSPAWGFSAAGPARPEAHRLVDERA
jgi:hypothetical protein